jgi:hypothetical protein
VFLSYLKQRRRALCTSALLGLLGWSLSGTRVASSIDSLATTLAESSEMQVSAKDIRWEPSRGTLADVILGRRALFLGKTSNESKVTGDVWRARVRVAPNGHLLAVASVTNLTNTPEGDDFGLSVLGSRAAFATRSYGHVQSVTVLELSGEGSQNVAEKIHDRVMASVTNFQNTGSFDGVARFDVTFDEPYSAVGLHLNETILLIDAAGGAGPGAKIEHIRFDEKQNTVSLATAHAQAGQHLPKWFVHWAVDAVRAVPWIGSEPIAWLEERAASARDRTKRTLLGGHEEVATDIAPEQTLAMAKPGSEDWPPQSIRSIWKTPEPGEGEWGVPTNNVLAKAATSERTSGRPPAFLTTYVRPDEERTYSKVLLVAMDMRQLELGMEAGAEDPKPLTGPPGTGKIPRDPAIYKRVVAAFNGGFKTEHGHYGMMLRGRVLLPPVPGAATLVTLKDGRLAMGSWGASSKIGGLKDLADESILSLRQNLDPLVAGGVVNPSGRNQWGYTLPGTSMQTERSGVCVTAAGHLMYVWGDDVSALTLAKAMKMGGCMYGMHLDMNPHHTGLIFANINEFKGKNYKSELLTTKMEISTDRYLEYAPKDFFYVMRREAAASDSGLEWKADEGDQPAPSWALSIRRASLGDVVLRALSRERTRFRVRAGTDEPGRAVLAKELPTEDASHVLLSATLGLPSERKPRGLVVDGKVGLLATAPAPANATAFLVVDPNGGLLINASALAEVAPAADQVELPALITAGAMSYASTDAVHLALGICDDGAVVIAESKLGAAKDVAAALLKAGAKNTVALERGSATGARIFRAGTASPPRVKYAETSLSVIATSASAPAFVFEALAPYIPKKK